MHHRRRCLRLLPLALHHLRPLITDFTVLAHRHDAILIIDDAYAGIEYRHPERDRARTCVYRRPLAERHQMGR